MSSISNKDIYSISVIHFEYYEAEEGKFSFTPYYKLNNAERKLIPSAFRYETIEAARAAAESRRAEFEEEKEVDIIIRSQ